MKIAQIYSHLNGHEHLLVHKSALWREIEVVVTNVDAEVCRTKRSEERRKQGRLLYSPTEMNRRFCDELRVRGWAPSRTQYWVTADHRLIRKTMNLPAREQKAEMERAGVTPIYSYNQTDFAKNRVMIEVQFGKYAFVAYDLFVKHMAFFVSDVMDVGVEIVPMNELHDEMSSGVPHYEGALYDLLRQGRSTPAVPLVLVGIAA